MDFFYQYILTPMAIVIIGYFLLRFIIKKSTDRLTVFDFFIIMLLAAVFSGSIFTNSIGPASLYGIVIVASYFLFTNVIQHKKIRKYTVAPPVLHGERHVDEECLTKTKLTVKELIDELRVKGFTNVKDVEFSLMEIESNSISLPLIINGKIINDNLSYLGKDRNWLDNQLLIKGHGNQELSDIRLATYNPLLGVKIETFD